MLAERGPRQEEKHWGVGFALFIPFRAGRGRAWIVHLKGGQNISGNISYTSLVE